MARRFATAVLTLGCMHASVVAALGLGELKLESFLNEPLSASVDLLNTGSLHEDQIRVRLATSDDFEKLGIDRVYFLTSKGVRNVSEEPPSPEGVILIESFRHLSAIRELLELRKPG